MSRPTLPGLWAWGMFTHAGPHVSVRPYPSIRSASNFRRKASRTRPGSGSPPLSGTYIRAKSAGPASLTRPIALYIEGTAAITVTPCSRIALTVAAGLNRAV